MAITPFLNIRKYELLLCGLILHLFAGIFIGNMFMYSAVIWPGNMLILGLAGFGVFTGKGKWKNVLRNLLFLPVMIMPFGAHYFRYHPTYFLLLSFVYVIVFVF